MPARTSGTDQVFASLVSTLLCLMDGLHDRGAVIVLGATNRHALVSAAVCNNFLHTTS